MRYDLCILLLLRGWPGFLPDSALGRCPERFYDHHCHAEPAELEDLAPDLWLCFHPHGYDRFDPWLLDVHCPDALLHQQPILPNLFLLGISLAFILLQNATTFTNDFFNLMSFGCACAYALTMVSAVRIHRKRPEWYKDNKNVVKGGDFTRILAMVIMLSIAFFCTLGQGRGSWISFSVYMGVGVVIWLWMVAIRWKKSGVIIETPDGEQQF